MDPSVYVDKTLRSCLVVTGFIALVLAANNQWWAITPMLAGSGLAMVLLHGWKRAITTFLTPSALMRVDSAADAKKRNVQIRLLLLALVKYPLIGLFLWMLVRLWEREPQRLMVFVGGFLLPQVVIALREMGRVMTQRR